MPVDHRRSTAVRALLEQSATVSEDAVAQARARVHANADPPAANFTVTEAERAADLQPDLAMIDERIFRAWAEARGLALPPTAMVPESVIEAFVAEQRHLMGLSHAPTPCSSAPPTRNHNPVVAVLLPEGTVLYLE